jgi:hypothetical protein
MGSGGLARHFASTGERHSTMAKTLKSLGGGAAIEAGKVYEGNADRACYMHAEGNRDIKGRKWI